MIEVSNVHRTARAASARLFRRLLRRCVAGEARPPRVLRLVNSRGSAIKALMGSSTSNTKKIGWLNDSITRFYGMRMI